MSICDELVRQQNIGVSFQAAIAAKQTERDELDERVKRFLRGGGKIKEIPIVARKDDEVRELMCNYNQDFGKKTIAPRQEPSNTPITLVPYKNRSLRKSKYGQNIQSTDKGKTFFVVVGSHHIGQGEKWTQQHAIEVRDRYRKERNMPPADY